MRTNILPALAAPRNLFLFLMCQLVCEPSQTFLQEIRDAIERSDRLLLVAGPRAFTSEYVRYEWQHAYETYKGINIALRLGEYDDFPAKLKPQPRRLKRLKV